MDYKFLDKVLDQIVSETSIDGMGEIQFPFSTSSFSPSHVASLFLLSFSISLSILFNNHCREVYGLNEQEIGYVWNKYKQIIKDKLKNNG